MVLEKDLKEADNFKVIGNDKYSKVSATIMILRLHAIPVVAKHFLPNPAASHIF